MRNVERAIELVGSLVEIGCQEFVVCAGARNAPLVKVVSEAKGIQTYYFPEERSASFFALGRMKSHGRPVAIMTTSGTAAAEVLPAVVEAYYSGLPLAIVTADRPPHYRGTGAPQSIEQRGIFSVYVEKCVDLWDGLSLETQSWSRQMPIHFNICFSEPLLDRTIPKLDFKVGASLPVWRMGEFSSANEGVLKSWLDGVKKPLFVLGPMAQSVREVMWGSLKDCQGPMLVDVLSGLKSRVSPDHVVSEKVAKRALQMGDCDAVVRVGGVPTHRLWRDMEEEFSQLPVLVLSDLPFSGLGRGDVVRLPLNSLSYVLRFFEKREKLTRYQPIERDLQEQLRGLLDKYSLSEPAWIRRLSERVTGSSQVYLGNSLPVREWDLAARCDQPIDYEANRGANGIDGQLSTFLGWAESSREAWCVLGDLTAIYDLAGLWALRARPLGRFRIVVINNGGGKIFRPMFKDECFENIHQLEFKGWADMWGVPYVRWQKLEDTQAELPADGFLLEIKPDELQSECFWHDWLIQGA